MREDESIGVLGGCYIDGSTGRLDCYNKMFSQQWRRGLVSIRVSAASSKDRCDAVHMTHNFFIARTNVVREYLWDPMQKTMEHETFFYRLHNKGIVVRACTGSVICNDDCNEGT